MTNTIGLYVILLYYIKKSGLLRLYVLGKCNMYRMTFVLTYLEKCTAPLTESKVCSILMLS